MTELFIGGIAAILPKNTSISVKRENPFFTKNGEYTYDVTLDLNNSVNAELYNHLFRINSVDDIKEKRPAILIADNRVYCNGTEIITGWTENRVSIQIASGNSELNFFIKDDLLISELDIYDRTFTPSDYYIKNRYPDIEFCLAPIYNKNSDTTQNEWLLNKTSSTGVWSSILKPYYQEGDYIAQPFLCAFIKKLMNALGYTLTKNDIENSQWNDLYICHLNNTTKWQKMVPGWSVGDFLKQIELLFDANFVIDSRKKEVRFLFNNSFYIKSGRVHVTNIIDEYEGEIDPENKEQIQQSNIQYAFPDNEYFRLQCIQEEIYKKSKKKVIPKSFSDQYNPILNYLYYWFSSSENQLTDTLFLDEKTGMEYVYYIDTTTIGPHYRLVNAFKPIIRDSATNTIKLEIMPVEMSNWNWYHYIDGVKSDVPEPWAIPAISPDNTENNKEMPSGGLLEQIINGHNENSESKGPIFLAFHQGLNNPSYDGWKPINIFPTPFTYEYLMQFLSVPIKVSDANLRLNTFEKEIYSGGYEIDTTRSVTFVSHDKNLFDVRSVFECRNKLYVCREIEDTITENGRSGAWKGIFHPIRISDTEAYQKWILTDGKWRDGGVWLDNGRWLDN